MIVIMKYMCRTTPEKIGISSNVLIRLMERLKSLDSLNSIILMRHGKICLEGWWKPYSPQMPHMLFSLSKSFTSAAIGIAVGEKRLKVSDRLINFFPEYDQNIIDSHMRDITLHHLLCMTTGHSDCAKAEMEKDSKNNYIRGFLSSRLSFAPGERFVYNSAATYMLAAIIKKTTCLNVREYLLPRLFTPLGIVPGIWECDPQGINFGGWGLYLTTEDIAKFAAMLLCNGVHNGRQLIPAEYLSDATRKQVDNSMNESPDWQQGYGYQFWRSKYGFRGDGACGQYAIVIPEKDLAIAITSCVENMQDILTTLWDELIPFMADNPLQENPSVNQKLLAILANLSMRTVGKKLYRQIAPRFFEFEENSAGIYSCSVEFGENECALTFNTIRGIEQLRAGYDNHRTTIFQLTDVMPHPTAASAAWTDGDILEIHTFCLDGTFRDTYLINFQDCKHPLTRTSRCSTFRPLMPNLICKK